MKAYLVAHDEFIAWLDQTPNPSPAEIDRRLWALAQCAADRGMTDVHWTFVVDGLVAHVNRRWPGNVVLSSNVARRFDLSTRWHTVQEAAARRAGASERAPLHGDAGP